MVTTRDPWAKYKKPERDLAIFTMYLGHPNMSMAEIGRMFHITRERVRQIILRERFNRSNENDQ